MTTTELLDRAAAAAKKGDRVLIVAANAPQREVFRRMIARRVDVPTLSTVKLVATGASLAGTAFDAIFVEKAFAIHATADDLRWLDAEVKSRRALNGTIEGV